MNKDEVVLFITEGKKPERAIVQQIQAEFFQQTSIKVLPVCLDIYGLYRKLVAIGSDELPYIDVLPVIQKICEQQKDSSDDELLALKRNQVSSIYLFFDYDGHASLARKYPECLPEMLALFDNETENGKLYINYPMIESYKHPICQKEEVVKIYFKEGNYKQHVDSICDKRLNQAHKLERSEWVNTLLPHLKSTNHLFNDSFSLPESYTVAQQMTQSNIYTKQSEKYIQPQQKVMVLSSFVWFLLEYLGERIFDEFHGAVIQSK